MSDGTPVTIWRDASGLTEYSGGSAEYIVDPSGNFLVDPSGTYITDTGVIAEGVPATIWTENNAI